VTRRGVVLGAGGVLGAAWMVGALSAVQDELGWDVREADVLVGTSAGSVLAALLGSGIDVDTMVAHQRGEPPQVEDRLQFDVDHDAGGALPPRPRPGIGSTRLVRRTLVRPRSYPPLTVLSAWLPHGQGTLAPVRQLVEAAAPDGWARHPATWLVAMDYDRGRRVAFGRPGAPAARLGEAAMASCSIPGWFPPVVIDGRRYVDGGACSPTSLDLLADEVLDEVFVLSPMTSFDLDSPRTLVGRLERRFRRSMTHRLLREAQKVERAGTTVRMLSPGREDLETIGVNLMDHRRRLDVFETSLRTSARALARATTLQAAG